MCFEPLEARLVCTATQLAFVQQPSDAVAGVENSPAVTVAVEDSLGATDTSDNSQVTLTLSSGTFSSASSTISVYANNGIATFGTFAGLAVNIAGSYTVAASDGTLTGANSNSFNITAASATQLAFVQQPTNATAGAGLSPAVAVAVEDQYGNVVTSDNGSTITVLPDQGSSAGTNAYTSSGVATFSSLAVDAAGSRTLNANGLSLSPITSNGFTISFAAASQIAFTSDFSDETAGIGGTAYVAIEDAYGNVVTSAGGSLSVTLSGGSYGGSPIATITAGVGSVGGPIYTAGSFSFTVTASPLTSGVSNTFTVSPGVPSQYVFIQQPTDTAAFSPISPDIVVAIEDSYGNIETADNTSSVALTLSSGWFDTVNGGTNNVSATVVNGVATFTGLIIDSPGSYYLLAAQSSGPLGYSSNTFTIS